MAVVISSEAAVLRCPVSFLPTVSDLALWGALAVPQDSLQIVYMMP